MLLTNWGSQQQAAADATGTPSSQAYDISVENVWIRIVTQWITMLMFGWSLVAPAVCASRDFS